jgi:hypothetical protein
MKLCSNACTANLLTVLSALTVSLFVAGAAAAPPPRIDESELLSSGFKVLVAKTSVQAEWVKRLPPGEIRPMQRNGQKLFIYPDAAGNQIYIGGPMEYEAYRQLHPDSKLAAREAVNKGHEYRGKQDEATRKATARDLTNPFLGADWVYFGM